MSCIVIIEDNPANSRLASRLLTREHDVFVADEGEEGLELVFEKRPDLVLVDLGLPDVDGQAIIGMIRQNEHLNQTRVIAFTAYPEETAAAIARVYRCDGVISKPIDTRTFPATIRDFLNTPAMSRESP